MVTSTSTAPPRSSVSKRLGVASTILNLVLLAERWTMMMDPSMNSPGTTFAVTFQEGQAAAAAASFQGNFVNATIITTYGHVHMAKTAGTEINGYLAARYERVCGHKGYSYDAYQFNLRVKQAQKNTGKKGLSVIGEDDIISKQRKGWNRGRVPDNVMKETGFEECDWISVETPAKFWYNDTNWPIPKPLELHVPCRDPVNHLMSQCHHMVRRFKCNSENIEAQVRQCFLGLERFDFQLTQTPNVRVKCFNPIPIEPYMKYMGSVLQDKRIPAAFIHRESNKPRNKDNECIWKNTTVREQVLEILLKTDYYKFCHECMGGPDDLLLSS